MNLYRAIKWKEFRDNVIELDGNICLKCGRSGHEVTLQVHHKKYIKGRKPWEYGVDDCITLCKGCHAAEHGIVLPKLGWVFIAENDLGDRVGTCENCGTQIRYSFLIFHKGWGTMEVGILCCNNLTESNEAKMIERYKARKKRFINSKKWKRTGVTGSIIKNKLKIFDIEIRKLERGFILKVYGYRSLVAYDSEEIAKAKAFDVINSKEVFEILKGKEF